VCRCILSRHTPDCTRRLRRRKTARTRSAAARSRERVAEATSKRDRPGAASPEPARRGRRTLQGTGTSREALAAGGLSESQARSPGGAGGASGQGAGTRGLMNSSSLPRIRRRDAEAHAVDADAVAGRETGECDPHGSRGVSDRPKPIRPTVSRCRSVVAGPSARVFPSSRTGNRSSKTDAVANL